MHIFSLFGCAHLEFLSDWINKIYMFLNIIHIVEEKHHRDLCVLRKDPSVVEVYA